jgi:hypothetical protein
MTTDEKIRSLINPRLREIHSTIQGVLSMGDLAVYVGQPMQDAMTELAQFMEAQPAVGTKGIQKRLHEAMEEVIGRSLEALKPELGAAAASLDVTPERMFDLIEKYVAPAVAEDAMRTYYKIICEESEAQ